MRRFVLPLIALTAIVACGPSPEEQAAAEAARRAAEQDSLQAVAEAAYDASVYDTLTYESPERRLEYGGTVYLSSCEKCHGAQGLGDAGAVMYGDTLRPPSFREPTWRLAGDLEGIRRAIYVGNTEGMPHWGLVEGLTAHMIDAAAAYILSGFDGS